MTGAISNVTGLSTMNYGALYNDPYFQAAFNSPNINAQQSIMNQGAAAQSTAAATTQSTLAPQATPSFKGASEQISEGKEKKKSNAWKWILGTIAVAGLAYGGYKCYNKGAGEGLAKIWDGAKQYLNGASNAVKGVANGGKADDVFTIAKNGDDVLCTVPGRTNVLKGSDLTKEAIEKLGGSFDDIALADKATEILKYEAKLSDGSVITVMGDKVRSVVNPSGAKVGLDKLSEAGNAEINNIIKSVKNKDAGVLSGLQNVIGKRTDGGVTRKFVAQATDAAKNGVRSASTKNFLVDSTAVKAYRQQYPQLSEAIDEFGKDVTSKFKIHTAEKVTDIGTFRIAGDKITGIQTATGFHSINSDDYKALLFDNKEIFDSVLSDPKKFTNIIYRAA